MLRARSYLLILLAFLLAVPAGVPAQPVVSPATGWLYAGSDVPPDPAWRLGVLPNGVRYAVRRNALPAGSVSVRVRMDVGALMETRDEAGYAHFIEHMLFRGSVGVPDGEGVRIWQRLGASFGSDTNAFTSATQTFYALDLPRNDAASLDTAMLTLAGMMRAATIQPALVDVERKVVLAERDVRFPPLAQKVQAVTKPLFYAGLRAREMEIGGTPETLTAATAERLRAFYERWYRPERATIVIVGDADPDAMVALLTKAFGDWKGRGPAPADPDFGRPEEPPVTSALVVDPQASNGITLLWARPHDDRPTTRADLQQAYVRLIAARILGRRMTLAARATGAPFTSASVNIAETRRIMDQTTVAVANRQAQWATALRKTFGILADAVEAPPSRGEIDREVAVMSDALDSRIDGRPTVRSPQLAAEMLGAVDSGTVVTTPEAARTIYAEVKPALTPANIGAAMRQLVGGEARVLMTAPVMPAGGERAFAETLATARRSTAEARIETKAVSFADLGRPPAPGRIVARDTIGQFGITRVRFANGVELLVKPTAFEKDRVLVSTTVGWGLAGLPPDVPQPLWTQGAVVQGGAGPLDIDAVERLLAGRRISLGLQVDERGFDYGGPTNSRDLFDALRLTAAAIAEPRFDPEAFGRLRAGLAGSYDSVFATPSGVFSTYAGFPLHSGDARWAWPDKTLLLTTTPTEFAAFWRPLLAEGPRRVVIVGDVEVEAAIRAVATTIGAMPTRPTPRPEGRAMDVRPPALGTPPIRLAHRGDPAQMLVAAVWPTQGLLRDLEGGRALSVAASIFQTRLFDRFRESEGGTYAPSVSSIQSLAFPRYGLFLAASQLRPDRRADFERAVREIAADLAAKGPSQDEVARAVAPIMSGNQRSELTNGYWASVMERDLDDPRVRQQIATVVSGYRTVRPDDVRRAARRWLRKPPVEVVVAAATGASAPALPLP